jgi:DNA-binding NtrC family response regulator
MKSGAFDYVVKPYIFDELLLVLRRAIEHKDLIDKSSALEKRAAGPAGTKIIGGSPQMRKLLSLTERAAKSDSNILIQGETGTGKELLAEYIHKISLRSNRPFVVINCASLPDQLIESELFGYEKGAFTDARTSKQGLVEIANGGTLFLDEIGEMSLSLQPKLLRFLENGEFRRIGGLNNIHSNVRIISATNRDLMSEVENKLFRKDLLFRLNVVTINLPPLRERPDDIIPLAEHFLQTKSPIRSQKTLSPNARKVLETYTFPGNVRELQHIIERAIIFSEDKFIHAENLFIVPQISEKVKTPPTVTARLAEDSVTLMNDVEKQHIENVLRKNNWDQTLTAAQLGISQKTLYNKIKKYQLRNTTA